MGWNNYFQAIDQNREYKGNWKKGETAWEGLGVIKFKDGSKYEGFTMNKMLNGKGQMTHTNGDIYHGEWLNGKAHGKGVFVDQDGSLYDGDWVHDI